jgi:hypothetical protein
MDRVYFNFIKAPARTGGSIFKNQILIFLILTAANSLLIGYCFTMAFGGAAGGASVNSLFSQAARPTFDLAAFESPAMADVKTAFKNFDGGYLKRLSYDLSELNETASATPAGVLKLIESAHNESVLVKSVICQPAGASGVSASVSGFTASNGNFITFSDYISRSKAVAKFSFDAKKGLYEASGVKPAEGLNFNLSFEMHYDKKN